MAFPVPEKPAMPRSTGPVARSLVIWLVCALLLPSCASKESTPSAEPPQLPSDASMPLEESRDTVEIPPAMDQGVESSRKPSPASPASRTKGAAFGFRVIGGQGRGLERLTEFFQGMAADPEADFVLSTGDLFTAPSDREPLELAMAAGFGTTADFFGKFYPAVGEREDNAYGGAPTAFGMAVANGWLEHVGIAKTDGSDRRGDVQEYEARWGNYYAVLEKNGMRLHAVCLYFQDKMEQLHSETSAFAQRVCRAVRREHPGEPLVVYANGDRWWRVLEETSPVWQADLLLGTGERPGGYAVYQESRSQALAATTDSGPWAQHFKVLVFEDRLVLLALRDQILGEHVEKEWRKVWIKPFAAASRPAADWEEVARYAGAATPGESERLLYRAGFSQLEENPPVDQWIRQLKDGTTSERAVALVQLAYSRELEKSVPAVVEFAPKQSDPLIRSVAITALWRKAPEVAVRLLPVVAQSGNIALFGGAEFRALAESSLPERAAVLLAFVESDDPHAAVFGARGLALVKPMPTDSGVYVTLGEVLTHHDNEVVQRWIIYTLRALSRHAEPALSYLEEMRLRDLKAVTLDEVETAIELIQTGRR